VGIATISLLLAFYRNNIYNKTKSILASCKWHMQERSIQNHLSMKLVPIFANRVCRVVSADPNGCILSFLDRSHYDFFQVAPQLYSWGWMDPVPDSLLLRKSSNARNRTRALWICSQEPWPLDYRGIIEKEHLIITLLHGHMTIEVLTTVNTKMWQHIMWQLGTNIPK
jgi:hypothetical protein